jgi:hypothetical protein
MYICKSFDINKTFISFYLELENITKAGDVTETAEYLPCTCESPELKLQHSQKKKITKFVFKAFDR